MALAAMASILLISGSSRSIYPSRGNLMKVRMRLVPLLLADAR